MTRQDFAIERAMGFDLDWTECTPAIMATLIELPDDVSSIVWDRMTPAQVREIEDYQAISAMISAERQAERALAFGYAS